MRRATISGLLLATCVCGAEVGAEAPPPGDELLEQEAMRRWTRLETANFRFRFPPDTDVREPAAFAADQEAVLTELLSWFGGGLSGKVDFFVWNDDGQARPFLGRPLAFAVPESRLVHTSPRHTRGHELTHIVVGDVLKPAFSSRFIGEGTAVVFDQSGRDLHEAATAALRAPMARPVSVVGLWGLDEGEDAVLYPLAGAFVARLIEDGGKDRFLALLRAPSWQHANELYGGDLGRIVSTFDQEVGINPHAETLAGLRLRARERMARDKALFSAAEMAEIESLYKRGTMKTEDGRRAYTELVQRFPRSNRAGCAALYLARTATGTERLTKIEQAITDFNDTWYGDGTNVGAYARTLLAIQLAEAGRSADARRLATEVASNSPDAIDHRGASLVADLRQRGLLGE